MRFQPQRGLLILGLALPLLLGASTTDASLLREIREGIAKHERGELPDLELSKRQVKTTHRFAVKGAKERRQVRYARWYLSLQGDRRDVYDREGHPTYRKRELCAGALTEHWTYPQKSLTYVFQDGKLLRKQLY